MAVLLPFFAPRLPLLVGDFTLESKLLSVLFFLRLVGFVVDCAGEQTTAFFEVFLNLACLTLGLLSGAVSSLFRFARRRAKPLLLSGHRRAKAAR